MNDKPIPHGTCNGYKNFGCRCDECRDAQRIVSRRYREANREAIAEQKRRYREAHAAQINAREQFKREKVRQQASRNYETWTEQEDSVVLNFDLTAMEIAFMLKRTHSAVRARRNYLRKKASI